MPSEPSGLQYLLTDTYSRNSLAKIKHILAERHFHDISPVANGLFAASSSQAPDSLTGYQNVCSDRASFKKQVHYFNRSLAQLTPAGDCPELYFLKGGRYIANVHTPLAWTQANQAFALHLMEKSVGES